MYIKVIVSLALLAIVAAQQPYFGFNLPIFEPHVVGGKDAKQGEHPYIVSLQWGIVSSATRHFCGGAILNNEYILTAGHCVKAVPSYGAFVVKAGKYNIRNVESGEQAVVVEKSIVHEKYAGGVAPYDIALLKLRSPLKLNSAVAPISLPPAGQEPKGNTVLAGWGSISRTSSPKMPDILQNAVLPTVDLQTCRKALESIVGPSPLHETNVCTGPLSGGYSACSGDSGGPLSLRNSKGVNEIVGVVSWGIVPCGTPGAPSVYVKVSSFINWIQGKAKL